jgi:hypothetical protein
VDLFYFDLVWKILFGIVCKQVNKEKKEEKKKKRTLTFLPGSRRADGLLFRAGAWAAEWAEVGAVFFPPREPPDGSAQCRSSSVFLSSSR